MNILSLSREKRVDPSPASTISRDAADGIRDLLHDTALLVTSLSCGGTIQDSIRFSERCRQMTDQLAQALTSRGYPDDIKREALLALCGLLDETALRYLPGEARTAWEMRPLQVERFSIYDAGRRVIDAIETRLHEVSPAVDLLEYYATILGLGFMGRFVREDEAKRGALIAAIDARLSALRADADQPFVTDTAGLKLSTGLRLYVPWLVVALACAAAIAVWVAGSRLLGVQLAQLMPVQVEVGGPRR